MNGKVIKIAGKSLKARRKAAKILVEEMMAQKGKFVGDKITVLVFIPEGMVSLIIGAKGRQIRVLTQDSGTDIVVNQPIHRMSHRTVKIEGEPDNISQAIAMIYGLLEERAEDFKDITEPAKPFNINTVKMTARFVIDQKVVGFVIGRNGQFTKLCLEKYDVVLKIVDQRRYQKVVRSYEDVAILSGRLREVQKCSDLLIEKVHDYFNNITRSSYSSSDNTKLLIPGYLVTKIIGARGCMIREIAARSGGTQIKILSDKSAERDAPEIVVSIAGSLKGKQEASAIILEQIELFKNGGPVLTTGSCLNDNIATQYKNSVQGQEPGAKHAEKRRSRYSSSESSRIHSSRSSSLEERAKRKYSDNIKSAKSKNSISMNEVYQIRAQLNAEFQNRQTLPVQEPVNIMPVQPEVFQKEPPVVEEPPKMIKKEPEEIPAPALTSPKPGMEDELKKANIKGSIQKNKHYFKLAINFE